ncbi:Peptidase M35 deuterolysin [Neofusicoccum parvum]|nr:Peptidase M35 deuterolysin [Neofusicoccum parvum]
MCTETLHLYRCGHIRGGDAARRRIEPCSRGAACSRIQVLEKRHAAHACADCRGTKVDGLAARLQQSAAERVRLGRAGSGGSSYSSSSSSSSGGRRY